MPGSLREKIIDMPLDKKVGDHPYSPRAAQVRALQSVYHGQIVPPDVQAAVITQAVKEQRTLQTAFKSWDETVTAGLQKNKILKKMALGNLTGSIVLSSGNMTQAEAKLRELQLTANLRCALLEELIPV